MHEDYVWILNGPNHDQTHGRLGNAQFFGRSGSDVFLFVQEQLPNAAPANEQ